MAQITNVKSASNNHEWWSKLTDGILASVILILIWMTVALTVRPIAARFGPPGLLIYVLGLLAVAMFSLQQALVPGRVDTARAWYGITGGFLAWSVAQVNHYLGVSIMPNMAGIVPLIMVALVVAVCWRPVLPIGMRFFCLTFLLNWSGYVFMRIEEILAEYSPIFRLVYRSTGYLAMIAAFLIIGWIFFQSRRRLHRLGGALAIWFVVSLALYVFRGSLF